jgi:Gas vesicle synthesis protein GvpL/GvpF
MGERKPKKGKGGTGQLKDAPAFYVYCVGERDAVGPLLEEALPLPIEGNAQLEIEVEGDLAAVMSEVPLEDYGEDALQVRLNDPTWTAVRAMRHEKVVEHFASRTSIVPLRFGTIYLERANIVQMLSDRRSELSGIIERLRGHEEWGVNIFCDRRRLMESITLLSPRLRELTERAGTASPGQSYLMRKKIDAMRADEARREIKRVVTGIEADLSGFGEGAVRLRVLKDEGGEHGDLVAKLAFLVARTRFEEFRAAAERLAQEHSAPGFKLELTGPWPAYNFAADPENFGF